ncbi:MAG: class I SAM-dependent methyltransferase [Methylacidiphilaceae bacterium]|nr:class I SAM-dependent methyltransferase [Candidatus Methylacidiphilaceae bacterium]
MRTLEMNSLEGKRLLALVRGGDYAHAGEEEAIDRVFANLPKRSGQWLLDVGCGRGGTADYVRRGGWGRVVGIDRDGDSLDEARSGYPGVDFVAGEVCDAPRLLSRRFAVVYLLNSFYAFEAQREALASLRRVAEEGARLLLFDYVDRGGFRHDPLVVNGRRILPHPIERDAICGELEETGWKLVSIEDLHEEYRRWYVGLVSRIEERASEIVGMGGEESLDHLRAVYRGILRKIERGLLGGVLLTGAAV